MSAVMRNIVVGAFLAVGALVACGPSRSQQTEQNGSNGGDGKGGTDASVPEVPQVDSDGGEQAGTDAGVRLVSITDAKRAKFCTDRVKLQGVVVVAVDDAYKGKEGDFSTQFWVVDPANPGQGIYVDKYFTDEPGPYSPTVGDVLDIEGYLHTLSRYDDRVAHRMVLKSQFGCQGANTGKLVITQQGTTSAPPAVGTPDDFGQGDGGIQSNRELAGARVRIPGPLSLTNPSPRAMQRVSANGDQDRVFFGFEVTGGILVNNYKTYDRRLSDGGTEARCDFRATAVDGGAVVFPDGISGVWDSYSHAPCEDGGTSSSCRRKEGYVPGTDAKYTFVLYPQDCQNDLAGGQVQ